MTTSDGKKREPLKRQQDLRKSGMPRGGTRKKSTTVRAPVIPERYMKLINGELSVEDLDFEELEKGQLKGEDGSFHGKPPLVIPRVMHEAVVREFTRRMEEKLRDQIEPMYAVLMEVAGNSRVAAVARNQAAIYLIERVTGKVPDRKLVQATIAKWESDVSDLLAD